MGFPSLSLKKISDELSLNDFVEFIEWPGHDKLSSYFKLQEYL